MPENIINISLMHQGFVLSLQDARRIAETLVSHGETELAAIVADRAGANDSEEDRKQIHRYRNAVAKGTVEAIDEDGTTETDGNGIISLSGDEGAYTLTWNWASDETLDTDSSPSEEQSKYQLEENFIGEDGEVIDTVWSDRSSFSEEVIAHHGNLIESARKNKLPRKILFTLHTLQLQNGEWETIETKALESYFPQLSD